MALFNKNSSQNSSGKQSTFGSIKELGTLLLIVFIVRTFGFGLYQVPSGSMETTMLVGERFFADKFTVLFTDPKRGDIISFNAPLFPYSKNSLVRAYQEYVGWPIWPFGPSNWTKRVIGIPGDHVQGKIEDGKPVVYLNGNKLDEPYINKYPLVEVLKIHYSWWDKIKGAEPMMSVNWKSYDPNLPDWKQPFYRITKTENGWPLEISENQRAQLTPEDFEQLNQRLAQEGATLAPNGRLLKMPAQPVETGEDVFDVTLQEKQYWLMGDNRRGSNDCRFFGPIDRRLIHGKIIFRIWSIDSDESWWIVDLIKHPIDFWSRIRWDRFFQVMH